MAGAVDGHLVIVVDGGGVKGELDGGRPDRLGVAPVIGVRKRGLLM